MSWQMACLLTVVALLPAAGAADGDLEPILYLAGPGLSGQALNFTSHAPNATEGLGIAPAPIGATNASWIWSMSHVPANWTLAAGSVIEAVLFLSELDSTVPVPEVPPDPAALGKIKVSLDVINGDFGGSVGTGYTLLDPPALAQDAGVIEVRVQAEVPEDVVYSVTPGESLTFGVRVSVSGRMPPDDSALMMVLGVDTPSSITVPTFPVAGFRAWEDAEAREAACNARVLAGLSCEPPVEEDDDEAAAESPAAVALLLASVWVVALGLSRARRR